MVDKLASHFVSKYFGKYVEGTNTSLYLHIFIINLLFLGLDSIDVGIFSSRVKFNNLNVKENIFDEYELPFTVRRGMLCHTLPFRQDL